MGNSLNYEYIITKIIDPFVAWVKFNKQFFSKTRHKRQSFHKLSYLSTTLKFKLVRPLYPSLILRILLTCIVIDLEIPICFIQASSQIWAFYVIIFFSVPFIDTIWAGIYLKTPKYQVNLCLVCILCLD